MVHAWLRPFMGPRSWVDDRTKQATRPRATSPASSSSNVDAESFKDETDGSESGMCREKEFWSKEQTSTMTRRPRNTGARCAAAVMLIATLSAFILATVLAVQVRSSLRNGIVTFTRPVHDPAIMKEPCGSNPDEARARNCHFDMVSYAWLPDRCYDAELTNAFWSENNLQWFLDGNKTSPLNHEEILTGAFTGVYVSSDYHLHHCTAMWKKMHRALLSKHGRRAVDGYIGNMEHTKHCERMLLEDRATPAETINTRLRVKYPQCGI